MPSKPHLLTCLVLASGMLSTTGAETVFPNVTGRNLAGSDITFPAVCSKAKDNVVIVAFFQEQQPLVDTWLPQLDRLSKTRKDLRFYELPTIKKMNRLLRWTIYKGMRSGIKDAGARSRTITLHIDKEPFKKQLGINTEEDIFVFLLDKRGTVKWRTRGTLTAAKLKALKSNLAKD